jgi:hypothetical protein
LGATVVEQLVSSQTYYKDMYIITLTRLSVRNWTVFLESARQVQKSGIGYGMDFVGQYDEETKLMNMISRDWQVDFFKTDETTW